MSTDSMLGLCTSVHVLFSFNDQCARTVFTTQTPGSLYQADTDLQSAVRGILIRLSASYQCDALILSQLINVKRKLYQKHPETYLNHLAAHHKLWLGLTSKHKQIPLKEWRIMGSVSVLKWQQLIHAHTGAVCEVGNRTAPGNYHLALSSFSWIGITLINIWRIRLLRVLSQDLTGARMGPHL